MDPKTDPENITGVGPESGLPPAGRGPGRVLLLLVQVLVQVQVSDLNIRIP